MNVIAPFVSDFQSPEAVQPCQCPFHHPAVAAKSLAGLDPSARYSSRYSSALQRLSAEVEVVSLIRMYFLRPKPRSPGSSVAHWMDSFDHFFKYLGIMPVRSGDYHRQRRAIAVYRNMALRALFASIRRIRTDRLSFGTPLLGFPLGSLPGSSCCLSSCAVLLSCAAKSACLSLIASGAATLAASTLTRDQSSWFAVASRSSNLTCSSFQTPASCHSRSLLQQVIPEPQPISGGSISQGMPL